MASTNFATDAEMRAWQFRGTGVNQHPKEIYDVFLCHNRADKDWVRQLAEQIESETFDGLANGRPLRVFFDEWDIDVGENVLLKINRGLTASRYLAVVISPEMLAGPWPGLEWTHVVSDDPTNLKGRIIPLFLRDYSEALKQQAELPAPFKSLNWIEFRRPANFKTSYLKLIRKLRDELPARGRKLRPLAPNRGHATPLHAPSEETAASPDRVPDVLLGNLLPVQDFPKTVWFAPTDARVPEDVRRSVDKSAQFILEDKQLLTFADLSRGDEPLRAAIDDTRVSSRPVAAWKDDAVRWRWIVSLLNRCLRSHFFGLPVKRDDKGRYFFRPKDGAARVWRNGNDPERTVADRKETPAGEVFWVHHGARLAFQTLGDLLTLCIEPCYVFTSDGSQPLEGKPVGPLSIKWGGKERNASILRHIVFWGRTLARGSPRIEISTGAQPVIISGIPAFAKVNFGVEFDSIGIRTLLAQVDDELQVAVESLTAALSHSAAAPEEVDEDNDE